MNILKTIADQLNGFQYPLQVPQHLIDLAKDNDVLIIYGESDELIEFRGLFHADAYVIYGGTIFVDKEGIVPLYEDLSFCDAVWTLKEAIKLVTRWKNAISITALWAQEPGISWTYKWPEGLTTETFEVMEDSEIYCRGFVFQFPANPNQTESPNHE